MHLPWPKGNIFVSFGNSDCNSRNINSPRDTKTRCLIQLDWLRAQSAAGNACAGGWGPLRVFAILWEKEEDRIPRGLSHGCHDFFLNEMLFLMATGEPHTNSTVTQKKLSSHLNSLHSHSVYFILKRRKTEKYKKYKKNKRQIKNNNTKPKTITVYIIHFQNKELGPYQRWLFCILSFKWVTQITWAL